MPRFLLFLLYVAVCYPQAARAGFTAMNFFPASGATAVNPDTPLRLTFSATPVLGAAGQFRIHDAATQALVAVIDVAAPVAIKTIGGLDHYNYHTVLINEREVTLFPPPGVLAYGHRYYVTADAGALKIATETFTALESPSAWCFTIKSVPPILGASRLVVAADGSGDFSTVQAALDYIPAGNTTPVTIFVCKGTYREIVFFTDKHGVTILGEDRQATILAYPNNAKFNSSGGNPFAARTPNPSAEVSKHGGNIYRRGMFLAHRVNDFTLANLTLHNTTPQGGTQAEALIVNGSSIAHTIIKDVDLYSFQDTIQINGQAYLSNCFIEGDVDFMWGTGPSFFENCTARSLRSGAYFTQIRNPATNHGFVFVRCTFEGAPGVTDNFLSRIEPHRFPHSEVVLVDCTLGPAVGSVGWLLQPAPAGTPPGATADLKFWEHNSRAPSGDPCAVSARHPASRQLQTPSDNTLISDYRNPTFVLGSNWQPRRAPIFKP
jgi:pectin methylesterase-like acyl-CoA thioesterase